HRLRPKGRRGSGRGGPLLPQGKPLSPLRKEREKPSDLHLICLLQRECSLTLSPRFMYQYCFSSAGRGNARGAMPFLMSFALAPSVERVLRRPFGVPPSARQSVSV